MPRQNKGFTFVEVMIVVFILGIVALALVPTFSSYQDEQKLIGASSELATALRFASSEATKTKTPLRVEISPPAETYLVKDNTTGTLLLHPIEKNPFTSSLNSSSPYSGVDIATVNGSAAASTIVFNTRGTVAADTTIVLQYAGHSRDIFIHSPTGRITVK